MISNIKNLIKREGFDSLLSKMEKGDDLLIYDEKVIYQITTVENQKFKIYDNISAINLGECENLLYEHYNISKNEPLIIFKIDFFEEGQLIPRVEYELYRRKEQLNLTICQNTKIKILYPAKIEENEEFKHNISSEYYNNICHTYTTKYGTDITIKDRKIEFNNNNMSLCESNCQYDGYNSSMKKAECNCEIKISIPLMSEIINNKDNLLRITDIKNSINLSIMKCYNILFSLEGLKKNIGNYILLSMIFIAICCFVIYLFTGHKMLENIINKVIAFKKTKIQTKKEVKITNIRKKSNKKRKNKKFKSAKVNNTMNLKNIDKNNSKEKNSNNPPFKKKNKNKNNTRIKYINNIETNRDENSKNDPSYLEINKKINKKEKSLILSQSKTKNHKLSKNEKNINFNKDIKYNDFELNTLEYKEALLIDKRNYIEFYFSLLRQKQIFIFTFYTYNDYNLRIIKICLILFNFSLYYIVNALFFNDSNMHKIYEDQGSFNFIYQISYILYSSIICSVINTLITFFSLIEKNVLSLKKYKNNNIEEETNNVLKCLKIKLALFFIILFVFMMLFWYYISCFCAIYKNTQIHLIKDTLISFSFSLMYPIGICFLPGIFRIPSLRAKKADRECIYKFSKIIQLI